MATRERIALPSELVVAHGSWGERADAGDLLEALGDEIIFFAALDPVTFQLIDLLGDVGQDSEQGFHDRQTVGGHVGQNRFVKRFARRIAHVLAKALEGEADGVDEVDAGADERVTKLEPQQFVLGRGGAVLDGMEQDGIYLRASRASIWASRRSHFRFGAGDGVQLARVGDEHGRTLFSEEAAESRAVRPRFQRDGVVGKVGELLREGGAGVGQRFLADDLTGGIQPADVRLPITEIQAGGEPAADGSGLVAP